MLLEKPTRSILIPVLVAALLVMAALRVNHLFASQPNARQDIVNTPTQFVLEIEGLSTADVVAVEPFTISVGVQEFRSGGEDPDVVRKVPGPTSWGNITLKRGVFADNDWWDWLRTAVDGDVERKDGSLTIMDRAGEAMTTYEFYDGFPCRWESPAVGSGADDVAVETIVVCVERMERVPAR